MFNSVNSYYKFHSKIYDITRWTILFGRRYIQKHLPIPTSNDLKILDLGCGTGKHLLTLKERYPSAHIQGIDGSSDMLEKAQNKVLDVPNIRIQKISMSDFLPQKDQYDLILCSYSLSMFGDDLSFIDDISVSLKKEGKLIVLDFDSTPSSLFERWMNFNHVKIDGTLFRKLKSIFKTTSYETRIVYFGLWKYSIFVGSR
jgi:S-adenosylmethionine-diacylgycerolhomoserine-N-methlytransferase